MKYFNINLEGDTLKIGFGQPAQNDQIVSEVIETLEAMKTSGELAGGKLVKINGPASLPVAMAIGHAVAHLYEVVACFDPKLAKYVVAVSHGVDHRPGDLID